MTKLFLIIGKSMLIKLSYTQYQENFYDPKDLYKNADKLQLNYEDKHYLKNKINENDNITLPNKSPYELSDADIEAYFYENNDDEPKVYFSDQANISTNNEDSSNLLYDF